MLVSAADGAFPGELQLASEALDIIGLQLAERGGDVGGRRRIFAQLLQRGEDLFGAAVGAAQFQLLGVGRRALGRHQALVHAGVEAADVAQHPGDVGVARLPVGDAVEGGEPADLLVEQKGHAGIEGGVVGDDLVAGGAAGVGRRGQRVGDGLAQACEFRLQRVDRTRHRLAVVKRARKRGADLVHLRHGAVGQRAQLVELGRLFRIDAA